MADPYVGTPEERAEALWDCLGCPTHSHEAGFKLVAAAAIRTAVEQDRAQVVAWLRAAAEQADTAAAKRGLPCYWSEGLKHGADAIERGEHRGEQWSGGD